MRPWSSTALTDMLPEGGDVENPLMVNTTKMRSVILVLLTLMTLQIQFYTWHIRGTEEISWWRHFEQETPRLKDMGVTHVWLPPPTKGSGVVCDIPRFWHWQDLTDRAVHFWFRIVVVMQYMISSVAFLKL